MFPVDLTPATITLPATENHSIVLITGKQLRHKRFALRMQQVFGELVVGWYELDRETERRAEERGSGSERAGERASERAGEGESGRTLAIGLDPTFRSSRRVQSEVAGGGKMLKRVASRIMRGDALRRGRERLLARRNDNTMRQYYAAQAEAEQALFGAEVAELESFAVRQACKVNPKDVNSPAFVQEFKALDPYFFLTLGGPLYKKPLLDAVHGLAINQHAGHSPDMRGSNTTQWALYHRQLEHVSATVHITTSGADAGPVLRRSTPCLLPTDSVNAVFARVVALGTELMIESVQEIIANKNIIVYPQPPRTGKTYLSKQFPDIIEPITRDFRNGWLQKALVQQRQF